jgi:hypothetical protein
VKIGVISSCPKVVIGHPFVLKMDSRQQTAGMTDLGTYFLFNDNKIRSQSYIMKKSIFLSFLILLISVTFLFGHALAVEIKDTKTTLIKKHPEIQQVKPKKPVKIKLKRSADGKYTWDLNGDDVDEIVKADKRLKKLLNIE